MKKICITGATGFIGSHFVELCVKNGFDVVAFDRYNSNNHWGWLENSLVKNDVEVILGDIRDYDSVNSIKWLFSCFSFSSFNWNPLFLCFSNGIHQNEC